MSQGMSEYNERVRIPFLPMTFPAISLGIHMVRVTSLKKVSGASLLPPRDGPFDAKPLIFLLFLISLDCCLQKALGFLLAKTTTNAHKLMTEKMQLVAY